MKIIKKSMVVSELDRLVEDLSYSREKRKEYEKVEKSAQAELVRQFKDRQTKSHSVSDGTHVVKATHVASSRVSVNEDKLIAALSEEDWEKISVRKLDKEKLEEAIVNGEIDAELVAECSDEKIVDQVRISYAKADPEEQEDG